MSETRQPGSELKKKWASIAETTDDNTDWNFWRKMADDAPLPNEDAHFQSHLILSDLWRTLALWLDSMERSGVDLSPWQSEISAVKTALAKRDAISEMYGADWNS